MTGISLSNSQDNFHRINLESNIFNHKIPWEANYAGWLQRIFHPGPEEPGDYSCPQKSTRDQRSELSCPPMSRLLPIPDSPFRILTWVAPAGSAQLPEFVHLMPWSLEYLSFPFSILPRGAWLSICPFFCWISHHLLWTLLSHLLSASYLDTSLAPGVF